MSVRLHLQRFARKFIFDVLPGALASLVGALFFAQQWTQAPMRTEVARVTAQNEQIVTLMREEQSLMRAVLEREHDAPVQRQQPVVKDAKTKDKVEPDAIEKTKAEKAKAEKDKVETTGAVPVRRRVEPTREAARAVPAAIVPTSAVPAAAVTASIAQPLPSPPAAKAPAVEPEAATLESGPLVAPQAEQGEGVITRIVSVVATLTNRTMGASGVRPVPGLMPRVPAVADTIDTWPSGHVLDAGR
jgi:hypothetical protein